MKIVKVTKYDTEVKRNIDILLKLLTSRMGEISETFLKEVIRSDNSHLFFAIDENGACMGMLTVGIYNSPTGKKAWIEDVVVKESYRGHGVGEHLTRFAVQFVKEKQANLLMLTSNPTRVAANNLYKKIGFERKETNVYKMNIE